MLILQAPFYLEGADFKDANFTGALLNNAKFELHKLSDKQVLSLHYEDPHARDYIKAIYKYMNKYKHEKSKHEDGFKHAEELIYSFINRHPYDQNGQNLLLKEFLANPILRFTSKLHEELSTVHKNIKKGNSAVPVTVHVVEPNNNRPT
ncbi:MAG TPA: pentapeptide repeat-containing protein [Gammaproteobacteria bacterium]|nr:pentapeptide repeat-containing protein [Gammaproteobacteria bacterium]